MEAFKPSERERHTNTYEDPTGHNLADGADVSIGVVKPKVHFNLWSCLGLNFSITATPLAIGTFLSLAVGVGGPPMFFYEFIFAGTFQVILAVAMAELASAIPHSTG